MDMDMDDTNMEGHQTRNKSYGPDHVLTVGHFEESIAQQTQTLKNYIQQEISQSLLKSPSTKPSMMSNLLSWSKVAMGQGNQHGLQAIDFEELSNGYNKLLEENQELTKRIELESREKMDANLQVNKLRAERAVLTEQLSNLRQMLIPTSDSHISDSEITQKFTSLRSQIQALVRQTWKIKVRQDIGSNDISEWQTQFFGGLVSRDGTWKCPYERLRHAVFLYLNGIIFTPRCYFLNSASDELEHCLEVAEEEIGRLYPDEKIDSLIEWRNATMKATERLRDTEKTLAATAQRRIWAFFQVLEMQSPEAGERGRQKLESICDQAVELNMMMRKAKDEIRVYFSEESQEKPLSSWEHLIDEGSSAAADSVHKPGHISYIYAGGLVKISKGNGNRKLVLEKAEAVVYSG